MLVCGSELAYNKKLSNVLNYKFNVKLFFDHTEDYEIWYETPSSTARRSHVKYTFNQFVRL
ncbi:Uncharacterized protein dnm_053290 [Desulfonema magnum]|uniref:Uncharacterized protein n=1 Tax=Desulfonema magnum TaxID=45655 RepID=A0A975GPX6_9BACT|nr:Uncharacterized protein dnm_053290 [Desulfonema magnum]